MLQIGLVGYGSFGKLITQHLQPYATFKIFDVADSHDSIEATLSQPIIILAIPAQYIGPFLHEHAAHLNPQALYIDVASVKVTPVATMLKYLPSTASIIATHPLFGPATAADSLHGRKIMVYPARTNDETYASVLAFLEKLGLTILAATPEEHDQAMAYVQGLSHYIGRIMQHMDIPKTEFATRAYDDLYDMKTVQGNDSDALFTSILHENSFTSDVLEKFEAARLNVRDQFKL